MLFYVLTSNCGWSWNWGRQNGASEGTALLYLIPIPEWVKPIDRHIKAKVELISTLINITIK